MSYDYDDYYGETWALSESLSDSKAQNSKLLDIILRIVNAQSLEQLETLIKNDLALCFLLFDHIKEAEKRIKSMKSDNKSYARNNIKFEKEIKSLQKELDIAKADNIPISAAKKRKITEKIVHLNNSIQWNKQRIENTATEIEEYEKDKPRRDAILNFCK